LKTSHDFPFGSPVRDPLKAIKNETSKNENIEF
jgi:hypothetical protein